jgi:hypothetical protein
MGQSPVSVEATDEDRTMMERAEARSTIIKKVAAFFIILPYPLNLLAEADSGKGKRL